MFGCPSGLFVFQVWEGRTGTVHNRRPIIHVYKIQQVIAAQLNPLTHLCRFLRNLVSTDQINTMFWSAVAAASTAGLGWLTFTRFFAASASSNLSSLISSWICKSSKEHPRYSSIYCCREEKSASSYQNELAKSQLKKWDWNPTFPHQCSNGHSSRNGGAVFTGFIQKSIKTCLHKNGTD